MKRLLLAALTVLIAATSTSSCTKYLPFPSEVIYDTITVASKPDTIIVPGQPHTDTLIVKRVDTVTTTRVDTIVHTRVDTVASPPVVHYDTTIVRVPVVVYVPRTDTLYLPGQVVHDTSWVYVQTNPTNPLGGGDPEAGLAYVPAYGTWWIVFWHGHFVGTVTYGGSGAQIYWRSYLYIRGQMEMPMACDRPTLVEAVQCLKPFVITIGL